MTIYQFLHYSQIKNISTCIYVHHIYFSFEIKVVILLRLLATTSADQTAKIWRTADLTLMTELKETAQRWVWDCAFSGDSQYIITGN